MRAQTCVSPDGVCIYTPLYWSTCLCIVVGTRSRTETVRNESSLSSHVSSAGTKPGTLTINTQASSVPGGVRTSYIGRARPNKPSLSKTRQRNASTCRPPPIRRDDMSLMTKYSYSWLMDYYCSNAAMPQRHRPLRTQFGRERRKNSKCYSQ